MPPVRHTLRDAIQHQFGTAAARYAISAVHSGGPDLDATLEAARLAGHERVLDVGCGAGHTALAFAARAAEVVALDLTPAMLEVARELARERGLENLSFECGDAMELPFPAASFDVVSCRLCAHHFESPERAVREAARVLRPGGVFLLVDSVAPEQAVLDTFLNAIELLRDPSHVRNHSVSCWRAWFDEAGLSSELAGRFRMRIHFDDWIARMRTPPAAAAQICALLDAAPQQVRDAYEVAGRGDYSFSMPIALLAGRRADVRA
jgi:SAM-dependent methyltransferase